MMKFILLPILFVAIGIVIACGVSGRKKASSAQQQVVEEATSGTLAPKTPEVPVTWAHPSKAVILGDLQVQITKTAIGKAQINDLTNITASETTAPTDQFIVYLQLFNKNATRKVDYRSWGNLMVPEKTVATLKDNFGNNYKRHSFGLGTFPIGAVEMEASIYPDKSVTDVLIFELPIANATSLDLELPAKNYGSDGMIRYRIPMNTVSRGSK